MRGLFKKALNNEELTKEDGLCLLNIKNGSNKFYKLLNTANYLTRNEFNNKGYIFAQIGLNAEPCSVNCKFCSMGKDHYSLDNTWVKDTDTIINESINLTKEGIDDLFLMTTADYDINRFIEIGKKVRNVIPSNTRLVANIGDFDLDTAKELKNVGFTGAYHICRLNEGIDTEVKPETRIKTLDNIVKAGLELYYCVEPIGPEHSYEQIVKEMLRARKYKVGVMAVMRRILIYKNPLEKYGQISALELTKIAAVTRLVSRPHRGMNAHETIPCSLLGGVNQLYAESGANPRDTLSETEKSRGLTPSKIKDLLLDAEYVL